MGETANDPATLRRVRRGIGLVFTGLSALLLWTCFLLLSGLAEELADWVLILVPTLCMLLHLGGQLFCLTAPPEWGVRGLLRASLVLMVLALGLPFLALVPDLLQPLGPVGNLLAVSLLPTLLSDVAHVLFLLFLARLTRHAGVGELQARVEQILTLWILLVLLPWIALVVMHGFTLWGVTPRFLMALGGLLIALLVLILYVNLLLDLFHALRRREEAIIEEERKRKSGWVDPPSW